MRILITGATGFLGNNLARVLLSEGHSIIATVRQSSNLLTLDGLDVEKPVVDLCSATDVGSWVKDVDAVVHSAAMIQIGWSKLAESRRANVETVAVLGQACRRHGKRLVHVSSVDALGQASEDAPGTEDKLDPPKPACSYVVSKREAESELLLEVANGLDGLIVNPGFMVGPYDWKPSSGQMMMAIHKNKRMPFAPAGGCSVADVRDVACGIASAIQNGVAGQRYILGGRNMSYMDLWGQMADVVGSQRPGKPLPNWIAGMAGKAGDLWAAVSRREAQVNSAATQMGQLFHYYDSSKAKTELGYQIGSVEDALNDAWDWFQAMKMV